MNVIDFDKFCAPPTFAPRKYEDVITDKVPDSLPEPIQPDLPDLIDLTDFTPVAEMIVNRKINESENASPEDVDDLLAVSPDEIPENIQDKNVTAEIVEKELAPATNAVDLLPSGVPEAIKEDIRQQEAVIPRYLKRNRVPTVKYGQMDQ